MSRSLVLGNGNMMVALDNFGQVRDFYFPYVGSENHVGKDLVHRIGLWADLPAQAGQAPSSKMSWLSDGSWEISARYVKETMASDITCENKELEVKLHFLDVVYNETNIFLRRVRIENLSERSRHIKVFFNQEFRISENEHADTAYYNPTIDAIVHYKGRRVFLVGGIIDGRPFDEYTVGLLGIEGREGSWKDAEDGHLEKNPIEHGSVDSVAGFSMSIEPKGSTELVYWVCVGETYRHVQALQKYIVAKTPGHLFETTQNFWRAWVNKMQFSFEGLSEDVVRLFKTSLLVIRTHCDNHGGILASGDSGNLQQYGRDTYSYIWPRDGAFTALALGKAGYTDIAERFYAFCSELVTDDGYVMHKYQPDKSLGSSWHPWFKDGKAQLAIQEDETAILIYAFWEHYKEVKDLEFVEKLYNGFVKLCAEFIVSFRDQATGLPAPSYELWEEKYGISAYTCSSIYGSLTAAANFAAMLGKEEDRLKYSREAERIRNLIIEYFRDPETGSFHKLVHVEDGKVSHDPTPDFSSFFGISRFGVLPADDPRLATAFDVMTKALLSGEPVRGIARYAGDKYFLIADGAPPNPWFITMLWAVQYRIARANAHEELAAIASELSRIGSFALPSGILSEQLNPQTGQQLSVSPLIWSHSAFVMTVIMYMERMEKLGLANAAK